MNGYTATWLCLLAERLDSNHVWGRFDHGRPGFGTTELVIVIGATTLFVITALVSVWRSKRRKAEFLCDSPSRLLHELSHAHRLNHADGRLLKKLAVARGIENPAELFVEPEHFDAVTLPTTFKVPPQELRQLRHELFE